MKYWLHLIWIIPLAALLAVSLFHQATRPPTVGERLAQSLRSQNVPLRPAVPLFDYTPPAPAANTLRLELPNAETLLIPPTATSATLDLPDWPAYHARDVTLHLRGTANAGLWQIDTDLHRAAQLMPPGDGLAFTILGNTWRIPHADTSLHLTPTAEVPALDLEVTWPDACITRHATRNPFLQEKLRDPSSDRLVLQALRATDLTAPAAEATLAAARARLLALTDEQLLLRFLQADRAMLGRLDDRDAAAELALCLVAWDPAGAVAALRGSARTVYVLTTADDAGRKPVFCQALGFDVGGREVWRAVVQHPRGGPEMLELAYDVSGLGK